MTTPLESGWETGRSHLQAEEWEGIKESIAGLWSPGERNPFGPFINGLDGGGVGVAAESWLSAQTPLAIEGPGNLGVSQEEVRPAGCNPECQEDGCQNSEAPPPSQNCLWRCGNAGLAWREWTAGQTKVPH